MLTDVCLSIFKKVFPSPVASEGIISFSRSQWSYGGTADHAAEITRVLKLWVFSVTMNSAVSTYLLLSGSCRGRLVRSPGPV